MSEEQQDKKRSIIDARMMREIQGYADKHGVINVPDPVYLVVAEPPGITLEYTHLLSVAKTAFTKAKCRVVLYKVINNIRTVLETKDSVPMMTSKERMSYGNLTTKQRSKK